MLSVNGATIKVCLHVFKNSISSVRGTIPEIYVRPFGLALRINLVILTHQLETKLWNSVLNRDGSHGKLGGSSCRTLLSTSKSQLQSL